MADETSRLYLTDVHLKGYKSIKDTKVNFNEGINIIIGPNGSGKTNFLEFLENSIDKYKIPEGESIFIKYQFNIATSNKIDVIKFDISYTREYGNFIEKQSFIPENRINAKASVFFNGNKIDTLRLKNVSSISDIKPSLYSHKGKISSFESAIKKEYGFDFTAIKGTYVRFNLPKHIEKISSSFSTQAQIVPVYERNGKTKNDYVLIRTDGNYLQSLLSISFLYPSVEKMEGNYVDNVSQTFNKFFQERALDVFVRFTPIQNIRLKPTFTTKRQDKELQIDNINIEFQINEEWYNWNQLSDGIKRVTNLLFEILNTPRGPILLEEPELGLYPDQLQKLLTFIKEQSSQLQFIITTHSPDVLDILGIDELDKINICEMKGEEGTKIRKMDAKEKKGAEVYFKNTGFLSDYWKHQNLGMK